MAGDKAIFRNSALLSGLVTQSQIDAAAERQRGRAESSSAALVKLADQQLAEMLVKMRVLTTYQAEQLMAGRTKLSLGPYLITDWIGQGGMGQVFKAVHKLMGREVAVKVLPRSRSTPETIANFAHEIRAQAQLDHPNLVRAYDAGHDGNVHYLVTEYVPGADLRKLVRSQGSLSISQAATVITQAARGLEHAHCCGLIHRDVKPGNLIVTPDGHTKLSDLGLAGFIDDSEADPRSGRIVGTADFLAPEVVLSPKDSSPVSDIYSLGCTIYYAVTGKVPFPGGTVREKLRRHCQETPWHPQRFNPELSEEFVEVIAELMEKDPQDRVQTAAEVIARLEPWTMETGPLPTQQLTRSPWMPPPLPGGPTGSDGDMQDTNSDSSDVVDLDPEEEESPSQLSQGTDPVASAAQETSQIPMLGSRPAPPIPQPDPSERQSFQSVLIALAIAIPVSLLIGALLMCVLLLAIWP